MKTLGITALVALALLFLLPALLAPIRTVLNSADDEEVVARVDTPFGDYETSTSPEGSRTQAETEGWLPSFGIHVETRDRPDVAPVQIAEAEAVKALEEETRRLEAELEVLRAAERERLAQAERDAARAELEAARAERDAARAEAERARADARRTRDAEHRARATEARRRARQAAPARRTPPERSRVAPSPPPLSNAEFERRRARHARDQRARGRHTCLRTDGTRCDGDATPPRRQLH